MKNLEDKKYWIWFSLITKLGYIQKRKLLEIYKDPEEIYKLNEEDLQRIEGIGGIIAKSIIESKKPKLIKKHIDYMKNNGIHIINIEDKEYPESLKEIYDPPISLYMKGNINILNQKNIAIIGCRECTNYGKSAAQYFAYHLSKNYINIVDRKSVV